MDLLPPSDLESTELVTPEKLLGLVPIAAHVIIGYTSFISELKTTMLKPVPPASVSPYLPLVTSTAILSHGFHS